MLMFPLDMAQLAEAFAQDPNGFAQFCAAMAPKLDKPDFRQELMHECDIDNGPDGGEGFEHAFDRLSSHFVEIFNRGA